MTVDLYVESRLYTTIHRNDILVANDHVARGDFVVSDLAENTGGESGKPSAPAWYVVWARPRMSNRLTPSCRARCSRSPRRGDSRGPTEER